MTNRIVILGGGTGGTIMANRLRRALGPDEAAITVIDRDDAHVYQPGLLFVPFGLADADDLVRPRRRQLQRDISFLSGEIDRVETAEHAVHLGDGRSVPYDVLIVATGARLVPEETDGMTGAGWRETVFDFYTPDGATALTAALERFDGGRLVVNLVDLPIKCPVAPLEFAFLADWFLTERGIRDRTELVYVTPLDGAFTKPAASALLSGLLADKRVELVTEFNAGEVDGAAGVLRSYDDREQPFDLLVTVPLHAGAAFIDRSPGLGDDARVRTHRPAHAPGRCGARRLRDRRRHQPAHLEGRLRDALRGRHADRERAPAPARRGSGRHLRRPRQLLRGDRLRQGAPDRFQLRGRAAPGRFPFEHAGLPLLRESRANHLGKLLFQWVYWHVLLPGREVPGISPQLRRHPAKELT